MMPPITVGALLPISRRMPKLDRNFLGGLRGALDAQGVEHRIALELTANAAVPAIVVEKVQRLLLEHRPAVVTGVLGAPMLRHVSTLFEDSNTPFIVANIGADPLLDGGAGSRYVVHDSLNLWRSTYALGSWAAAHVGQRACAAVGYHEAGYSIVGAFWAGYCAAGGEVLATEVTHRSSADEDPSEAVRRLLSHDPELIVALSSGPDGVSLVKSLRAIASPDAVPVVCSAPMVHSRWLAEMGGAALGIRTVFGWDATAESPAQRAFHCACAAGGSADADLFALLGYESGLAIASATKASTALDGESLLQALGGVDIESPRARLRLDAATREIRGGVHYLFEVQSAGDERVRVARIGAAEPGSDCDAAYAELKRQDIRAGWTNPYLVT